MRGVYSLWFAIRTILTGSSPHARGLHDTHIAGLPRNRIIPACAGFTRLDTAHGQCHEDHPRMRGVYYPLLSTLKVGRGSSPHARGLLQNTTYRRPEGRIIPACAGFTLQWAVAHGWVEDHPRMRGVYCPSRTLPLLTRGSSPHARGLLLRFGSVISGARIIPACAGFTPPTSQYYSPR